MFCWPWRTPISPMVFGSGGWPGGRVAKYAAASEASGAQELHGRKLAPRLIGRRFDDKTPGAERPVRLAFVGVEDVPVGLVSRKRHVQPLLSPMSIGSELRAQ